MKKSAIFLGVLCALVMVLAVTGCKQPSDENPYDEFTIELVPNTEIYQITAYTGTSATLTIPARIRGKAISAIASQVFKDKTFLTSVTIEQGIIYLFPGAFTDCTSLRNVTMPATLINSSAYVFRGCSALESITIPEGTTRLSEGVFWGCTSLTSVSLPSTLSEIGKGSFGGCAALITITIPAAVTEIASSAFNGCTSLTEIIVMSVVPPEIISGSFPSDVFASLKIKVPAGSVAAYKAAGGWKDHAAKIVSQ